MEENGELSHSVSKEAFRKVDYSDLRGFRALEI